MGNVEIDSRFKRSAGPATLIVGLLITTLAGCASTKTAADIQAELAKLREEQRVLIEEVTALRAAVRRLAGEPVAADQAPAAPAVEPRTVMAPSGGSTAPTSFKCAWTRVTSTSTTEPQMRWSDRR